MGRGLSFFFGNATLLETAKKFKYYFDDIESSENYLLCEHVAVSRWLDLFWEPRIMSLKKMRDCINNDDDDYETLTERNLFDMILAITEARDVILPDVAPKDQYFVLFYC